jgi:hypothetical protein
MQIISCKISYFILLFFYLSIPIKANDTLDYSKVDSVHFIIQNHDTIYVSDINEIIIQNPPTFSSEREYWRYERLIRNVKKVYPYAKMAGAKYREVEAHMLTLKTEREKNE